MILTRVYNTTQQSTAMLTRCNFYGSAWNQSYYCTINYTYERGYTSAAKLTTKLLSKNGLHYFIID